MCQSYPGHRVKSRLYWATKLQNKELNAGEVAGKTAQSVKCLWYELNLDLRTHGKAGGACPQPITAGMDAGYLGPDVFVTGEP